MIRHLVLVRFRADADPPAREALMRDLAAVVSAVPGCGGFRVLRNATREPGMSHGFEDVFALDFADAAARDRYLADPAHRAVGARLLAAAEGGAAGVLVFDVADADAL